MLKGKVDKKDWNELKEWIISHVEDNPHLIFGTGGNINKIHKLLGLKEKAPVELNAIRELYSQLEPLSIGQRMDQFQLKPDRADVIVPAMEIFMCCLETMKAEELIVPKIGLSDGIIFDFHSKN
jgi:exopolyphosphatase/guanosine-5'-triphosphate,3'-diphosphate pyrophosphatase